MLRICLVLAALTLAASTGGQILWGDAFASAAADDSIIWGN